MNRFLKDGKHIEGVWNDLMKKSHIDTKLLEKELLSRWEEIAGSLVARHTLSLNLSKNKLYIRLDSAPLKQEVNSRKVQLLTKINSNLKSKLITEIDIK